MITGMMRNNYGEEEDRFKKDNDIEDHEIDREDSHGPQE